MDGAENKDIPPYETTPQHASKPQSAISTRLFMALGFITLTAIGAGLSSIIALNRFQDNFDTLINNELPTLEDTAHISQLAVTVANLGASLIISPTTWARENLMGQVADDTQWLKEILTRVSDEALAGTRKENLLNLNTLLLNTYSTLNTLTENRIIFAERLDRIDLETLQLQQDIVTLGHPPDSAAGALTTSEPLERWNTSIHAMIFNLQEARRLKHPAPLQRLEEKVQQSLAEIRLQLAGLPSEAARLEAEEVSRRLSTLSLGSDGLFAIKRADFDAAIQIEATLREARTIAEQFMSASQLATRDIRKSINTANQQTSKSMTITLQVMVAFIFISTLVALGTFLYVSRTVLRRLVTLRRSMVAHAEGTTNTIDTSGGDEITDMARSLQYLVDTLHSREVGLTQAKEEAEHASTAKTRFLAAASHDLRQPLQALNLFVYALEGKEKDEEKREIIHLIRNSLDSLKELLNTLLDISKLEAGVVQANMKDFAAGPMIDRIKSELTAVAWASDLELRTVSSSVTIHSDPSLLETTIRNLVDNAIKYTERGRVLVGCRRRGDRLRFEVWDTGPGIPKDQRELIFQDFYQIDNEARKRIHGLGLGLSIVKRMTALLGGNMGCDSWPGKGSVFWVDVPTASPCHEQNRRDDSRLAIESLPTGDAHIVLVEDDEQVLLGLKSLLESRGYTTLAFQETGRNHITDTFAVKKRMPDLIIADYRLEAKATGSEVINMIREILGRDIPAIIITGDTAPERLREAKRSGFPMLHKPVRPEELMIAIRHALGEAKTPTPTPTPPEPKQSLL